MAYHTPQEVLAAFANAYFEERSIDVVLSCVTEDVEWIGTETENNAKGKQELKEILEPRFAAYPHAVHVELEEPILQPIGNDGAILTVVGQQPAIRGITAGFSIRETVCCVKNEDGWLISNIHNSTPSAEFEKMSSENALLNTVPAGLGIFVLTKNGISQYFMNDAFYDLIGARREDRTQYSGSNILMTTHPKDLNRIQEGLKELLEGKNLVQLDYRIMGGSGDWVWLHLVAAAVERKPGSVKLHVAYYECTEAKELQLKLFQNQRAVALAEQQGKISVWTYNIDKGIIVQQVLDHDSGHMGYPEIVSNVPDVFIDHGYVYLEDVEKYRNCYLQLANGEEKSDVIYRLLDLHTGEFDWVHMYYQRMEDNDDGDRMAVGFSLLVNRQQEAVERFETEKSLREQMYANAIMYTEYNLTESRYEGEDNLTELYRARDWERQTFEEYRKNIQTIVEEEFLDGFVAKMYAGNLIQAFKQGESKVSCEYRSIARPDMPSKWYRTSAVMVERPDTGAVMAFIYIEDIDDEKNRQIAIESSMSDGIEIISIIHVTDGKARLIRTNYPVTPGGLGEYFTYDEEFVSRSHQSTVDEYKDIGYQAALLSTVRKELETKEIYQYSISTQRGEAPRKRQLFRFRYLDDRKTYIVLSVSDVTALYLEEQERNNKLGAALSEAKSANKAKTDFLSRVSHDMRTPLNGILGLTTLLRDTVTDPDALQDLSELEMSGKYLLDLINDTLDMNRIESGNLELHPVVYDGRTMFNNVIRLGKMGIGTRNITYNVHADNIPFSLLYVDVSRFEQIFMNILGNAVKFTPDGGSIDLTLTNLERRDDEIINKVVISDTGVGMSPEFLPHIFEAFSQEDASKTSTSQGTGLGMAITKQLVELMGGSISVESEVGKGTTFTVIIKVHLANKEQIEQWRKNRNLNAGNVNLEGKKILLVEDHPINTKIATKLLETKGMIVEHAENGQVGVDMFKSSTPDYYDAVLMDIRMPVMDGIEATKVIRGLAREDAKTVPIIAMTANAFADDIQQTQAAGMNEHLSKPIQTEVLYTTLAEQMKTPTFITKSKILIVDDVEVNRAVLAAALSKEYEIMEAENGEKALEIIKNNRHIDAVITDIQMPGMDGIELIRQIRKDKNNRHIAIIASTQFGDPEQEELLLSIGANDFVYKPMTPTVVEIRVRNALKINRM